MSEALDQIRLALSKLDTTNDDHWTENGQPALSALGLKPQPSRADVTAAAPLFSRASPKLDLPEEPKPAPAPVQAGPSAEDDYAAVVAECDAAEAALREANDAAKEALAKAQAVAIKRDAALKRLEKLRPKDENMQGIRAVLERSKEVRQQKAELAQELKRVGVTAALLQPGSKLDQAMTRKRGFGLNRPQAAAGAK